MASFSSSDKFIKTEDDTNFRRGSQTLGSAGSKYKHMFGTENPKNKIFFNLQLSPAATDGPVIACSSAFWAVPYQGGGGPVYISPLDLYGKVEPGCAVLNGHKSAVQDIAFSPFKPSIMATGSLDCTTNIWDVTSTEILPLQSLTTHRNSVRSVLFHPSIPNLLVTSSLDQTLRFSDIETAAELNCINYDSYGPDSVINNISFCYDGSIVATASRDKSVRICDPRAPAGNQVIKYSSTAAPLARNSRLVWVDNGSSNTILTTSSLPNGQRMIALWDLRGSSPEPVVQKCVDTSSGQLFPLLDESTGLCFLVGKGDTVVKYYETLFLEEMSTPFVSIDKANEFQTSRDEPFAGVTMLPKSTCNVAGIECARLLKLTSDSVIPLSFIVPRADALKDFFQDDLYPPIRSSSQSNGSIHEWCSTNISSSSFFPVLESLRPSGMIPFSERPIEVRRGSSKMDAFREQVAREEAEKERREMELRRLQDLANQHAKYNPNLSMVGGGDDVQEDEWDD